MNLPFFKDLFQKNKTLLALSVILFVTIYPRIQVYFLPFTKQLAEGTVYKELANETKEYIKDTYGTNLTADEEDKFVLREYKRRLKDEKIEIEKNIKEKIKEKKALWQNADNQTYLLEFDPYYLYRYTKNLVDKGTISDEIVDGRLYDKHSYAPKGKFIRPNLTIYTGFIFHKIFSFFNKDLPLVNTLFFLPLVLSVLVSVAIFFFVKRFFGILVAVISSFVITLTPIFLTRSTCGWFDTDCFNLLFPLLVVFIFYSAIRQNSLKKAVLTISLASFSMGLYSLAWVGWWHLFYIILAGTFLYTLNTAEGYFKYKEKPAFLELKKVIILSVIFIVLSLIIAAIIQPSGFNHLVKGPIRVFQSVYAKQSITASLWPNTFLTVAELKPSDLGHIIYLAGDPFIFFIALCGLFLLIKPRPKEDRSLQYLGFVFTVWLIGSVFASLKALRFSLLMAIPQGICFAVAIKFVIDLFFKKLQLVSQKSKLVFIGVFVVIVSIFVTGIFMDRSARLKAMKPMIDDDYVGVLERIQKESHPDTIINSWWDYGSWYAAIGQRRVIFDGTTQHSPMAFWMARVLLTDNEDEAVGILRMLNNGSNQAFEELKNSGLDDIDAIQLLRKIIVVDKKEAQSLLQQVLPEDAASKVLNYTHASAPPVYFIVDDHMTSIIYALTLLGNWSPEKAYVWQAAHAGNAPEALRNIQQKLGYTTNQTIKLYKEAVPLANKELKHWASRTFEFHSSLSDGVREGATILFDNNVALDLDNFNARIKTKGKDGWKRPYSLIYPKGDSFSEIVYEDGDAPFTILLIPEGDGYKNIILDRDLAKSMLVRLFFLKGHGLKYFRFLYSEKQNDFGDINVWEIDWEGQQNNKFSID